MHPIIAAANLPAPRIELRWRAPTAAEKQEAPEYLSVCDYSLVLPLRAPDIRAERFDGQGERLLPQATERHVAFGGTASTGRLDALLCHDYICTPYRESKHAMWDGDTLGRPPIYVIVGDKAQLIDYEV